jgi:hypothetical protein
MQGGCGYCNDNRFRSLKTIEKYAVQHGLHGDYMLGYGARFYNAEVRYDDGTES